MNIVLTEVEARVLGALLEKETTTPDYYPLSLNALANACNQKSNREPVMNLDEATVRGALETLQQKALAGPAKGADSRVTKYEHRLQEIFNFDRREAAILCVLMLRGPQTPGELRGRTERMYRFEDLDQVQTALQQLMRRELVKILPRQPGTKEARYAHLLSGDIQVWEAPGPAADSTESNSRMAQLEEEIAGLKREVAELRQQIADFRKQFD
jgi:uncharacterized protein